MEESVGSIVRLAAQRAAAEAAVRSIGLGYDITVDFGLSRCKRSSDVDPLLISLPVDQETSELHIPGCGICISRVPKLIKCDKGERIRFAYDARTFQQMSELFNQRSSVAGKVPTGHFNEAFEFSGVWQRDAAETKGLALERVSVEAYNIAMDKTILTLRDHVKQAVPESWDPAALARFIMNFGTHIVVGVKVGGEDAVYAKQNRVSPLSPDDLSRHIKVVADKMFVDETRNPHEGKAEAPIRVYPTRRGVRLFTANLPLSPCSFVPISSLLNGIRGNGFLSHAINLYARYKPPIEELHHFLDFQLPRQWAPALGDLPLGPKSRPQGCAYLQFSFMGSKLYVNTTRVDKGKRATTGMRLYLEGKARNKLAIHLQHLSKLPISYQLEDDTTNGTVSELDGRYHEKVGWKWFSLVCTAAVEADDDLSIVTGAQFEVKRSGFKTVIFLRLHFSRVTSATGVREIKWDVCPTLTEEPGVIATLIRTHFSTTKKPPAKASEGCINSAVHPDAPPVSTRTPKMERYVDTSELARGAQDSPGRWVVSGARLVLGKGKIALMAKYSLLHIT